MWFVVKTFICWTEVFPRRIPPQWDTTTWHLGGTQLLIVSGYYTTEMFALQRGYYNVRWYVRGKWSVRDISTILNNTQETLEDNICTAKNVFTTNAKLYISRWNPSRPWCSLCYVVPVTADDVVSRFPGAGSLQKCLKMRPEMWPMSRPRSPESVGHGGSLSCLSDGDIG